MIEAAVIDASVAVEWVFGEAGGDAAAQLAGNHLSAPDILLAECGSALWAKAIAGSLPRSPAMRSWRAAGAVGPVL